MERIQYITKKTCWLKAKGILEHSKKCFNANTFTNANLIPNKVTCPTESIIWFKYES